MGSDPMDTEDVSSGGTQFTATANSVATSCDPPVWRAAILAAVGRAVLGEPRGEGRSRAPTNWESRLPGGAFPPRPN